LPAVELRKRPQESIIDNSASPRTSLFELRDFRIYIATTFAASLAAQAQSVAVGWQVYKITRSPLALGYVGLAQFLPALLMMLPAGDVADRYDRRMTMCVSGAFRAVSALVFVVLSMANVQVIWPFYAALAIFAAARTFAAPAADSLLPRIVPESRFSDAVAWSSSSGQTAIILGPALGGALYLLGPAPAYAACLMLFLLNAIGSAAIRTPSRGEIQPGTSRFKTLTAGVSYVRLHRIILGAISLDLFAVLLGGATALLPIYARDILHVGPAGLGLMRSAPAAGAVAMGLALGRMPLRRRAGATMFACVALFGAATIVFGISTSFILSLAMLVTLGAADMVSVYVRRTLMQFATPDAMRGRVSSVERLFVGASNELGGFESGVTAEWFGTVPSVVIGGIGTIAVVVLWQWGFPEIRNVDDLNDVKPYEMAPEADASESETDDDSAAAATHRS
jgi:MFS family permease